MVRKHVLSQWSETRTILFGHNQSAGHYIDPGPLSITAAVILLVSEDIRQLSEAISDHTRCSEDYGFFVSSPV
jgi:hypothetical protein